MGKSLKLSPNFSLSISPLNILDNNFPNEEARLPDTPCSSKVYSYMTSLRQFMDHILKSADPLFQVGENSIEVIRDLLDLAFLGHQILLDLVDSDVQSTDVHF